MSPVIGGALVAGQNLHEFGLVKNNIDGVRLAQIAFSTGAVTFNPASVALTDLSKYIRGELFDDRINTQAAALGSVAVTTPGFCKQYTFSYSYFGGDITSLAPGIQVNSTISTDVTRLKLDQVVETACDGTVSSKPWIFGYNGNFLPRRLSFAQDHWGFYNGQEHNNILNTLIPTYYADASHAIPLFTGANRDADSQAMAKGILTTITYPTGGNSTFTWEPNDVWANYTTSQDRQVAEVAGGRRIGNPYPWPITITLSANPYRFTLDFTPGSDSPPLTVHHSLT